MINWLGRQLETHWKALLLVAFLAGYWLLPISGQVFVVPGTGPAGSLWPQMRLDPAIPRPGQEVTLRITDITPWAHILATVNGQTFYPEKWWQNRDGTWTWQWALTAADSARAFSAEGTLVTFYRDCHTGCIEQSRMVTGHPATEQPRGLPTKLGIVFASPERNWHGRSGWDVELTYARLAAEPYWGIDDLAARVYRATAQGLRVLVRVDYDRDQSLPPAGDQQALRNYLAYLQRLARDDRLGSVYGYIIGSGYNALDSNALAPAQPVTPDWYARLFNGYGEAETRTDNAIQTIRAQNTQARVLVGPVRPWVWDQDGEGRYAIDAPWLNYFHSLVACLDQAARAKAAAGISLAAPDGFALQTPGRPDAPELARKDRAAEPQLDLRKAAWGGAQAGFRIYQDWLAIINDYPSTRGLPAYITSCNTFAPDEGTRPSLNYPRGWLTNALQVIDEEPQVLALCWFLDVSPSDGQWDEFSLRLGLGQMAQAAEEFDALLR